MIVEKAVSQRHLKIFTGHVAQGADDFGEVPDLAQKRELGLKTEFKPGNRVKVDFIIEIGEFAIKFRVFLKPVEVGVD